MRLKESNENKKKSFVAHVGLAEDELANSFTPEDLPSSADKVYKAVKNKNKNKNKNRNKNQNNNNKDNKNNNNKNDDIKY